MCRAGATLDDVPARVSWTALRSFVAHLDPVSALWRELHPDMREWLMPGFEHGMLADIYDGVLAVQHTVAMASTQKGKRRPRAPKPYPRPGARQRDVRLGSEPIPISNFDAWWDGG